MERTLIAWNLPNMITIPLMAAVGFIIAGFVWQLVKSATGGGGAQSPSASPELSGYANGE